MFCWFDDNWGILWLDGDCITVWLDSLRERSLDLGERGVEGGVGGWDRGEVSLLMDGVSPALPEKKKTY